MSASDDAADHRAFCPGPWLPACHRRRLSGTSTPASQALSRWVAKLRPVRSVDDHERARLRVLLDRATTQMGVALADAREAHDELAKLLLIGQARQLNGAERARYAAVEHAERDAAKRYLAARHWRDGVTSRLRDLRLRGEEATSRPPDLPPAAAVSS